jgi:sugar phosphate isomerase/epimerase
MRGAQRSRGASPTDAQGIDWVVQTMKPACEYTAKKGITLGIEDHGRIPQEAEACLEIMRRVDSPFAGINLHVTHFIPPPPWRATRKSKCVFPLRRPPTCPL